MIPAGFDRLAFAGGFAAEFGPMYARREGDHVAFGFRVEDQHLNPKAVAHGGAMATFADMQLAALMRTCVLQAKRSPTISLSVDFLAPAPPGAWVEGEIALTKRTRRLAFTETVLTVEGEPVARSRALFSHAEDAPPLDTAAPPPPDHIDAPAPEGWEPLDPGPGFGAFFGPMAWRDGPPRIGFRVAPRHINLFGFCHGGALAMLADYQLAPLRRAGLVTGGFAPTLSLSLDYVSAAKLGDWVEAEVALVRATGRYVFTQAVLSNAKGAVARASAIYAMTRIET